MSPEPRRLRWEDSKFEANIGNIERLYLKSH